MRWAGALCVGVALLLAFFYFGAIASLGPDSLLMPFGGALMPLFWLLASVWFISALNAAWRRQLLLLAASALIAGSVFAFPLLAAAATHGFI